MVAISSENIICVRNIIWDLLRMERGLHFLGKHKIFFGSRRIERNSNQYIFPTHIHISLCSFCDYANMDNPRFIEANLADIKFNNENNGEYCWDMGCESNNNKEGLIR